MVPRDTEIPRVVCMYRFDPELSSGFTQTGVLIYPDRCPGLPNTGHGVHNLGKRSLIVVCSRVSLGVSVRLILALGISVSRRPLVGGAHEPEIPRVVYLYRFDPELLSGLTQTGVRVYLILVMVSIIWSEDR